MNACSIFESLDRWACDNHVPLQVALEITQRCNLRCRHCYNLDRTLVATPELSLTEIQSVLVQLREAGTLFVQLTGGEPMAHPGFLEILDLAREQNLALRVLTNGTYLEGEAVRRLAGFSNLMGLSISLYGAEPSTHDAITGVPGSWEKAWNGIRLLREADISVRLKFVILRSSVPEVPKMIEQAEAADLPWMVETKLTDRLDGTKIDPELRITAEQRRALFTGPLRDEVPRPLEKMTDDAFACNCARRTCAITCTGEVWPCLSVPLSAGNLRERSFAEIWNDAPLFQEIRGLRMTDYPSCGACEKKSFCRRDRGAAVMASGRYTGIDPDVCREAELFQELLS